MLNYIRNRNNVKKKITNSYLYKIEMLPNIDYEIND